MSNGMVVIVTGGARGIGLGITKALLSDGCTVALTGRKARDKVAGTLESLTHFDSEFDYFSSDVAVDLDRRKLVDDVLKRFGRIDGLVNNAGIAPTQRMDALETTEDSFDHVLDVNLKGPHFLTQLVASNMIADSHSNEGRCIVNITSISSTVASPSRAEYCISKAGLAMSTNIWAVKLAEFGISVFEVRPGIIGTDMTSEVTQKYDALFQQGLALQARWGTPADVGKAVSSFVRGDFPYSTGTSILVDGGMLVDRL